MPTQYWASPVPSFHVADGTAVTGATITELSPTPRKTIAAPTLNDFGGKMLEFSAAGIYTTNATAGTFTFTIGIGPIGTAVGSLTVVAVSSALSYVVSQTNRFWRMEGEIQFRTVSATGTCIAFADMTNVSSGQKDLFATTAGSTAAVNTTVANEIVLAVTPSAAQSITCRYFNLKAWA